MSTLGKLATLSVLLVLIAIGTGAAYTNAAKTQTVTNESITVDYSAATPVDATDEAVSFGSSVTVFNSSDTQLTNGTDYTWHPSNGSVTWHDTSLTTDGETAAITYDYDVQDDNTQAIAGVLRMGIYAAGLGLLLFGGLSLLGWLDAIPGGIR